MTKNPLVLLMAGLAAALLSVGALFYATSSRDPAAQAPLAPTPGEAMRVATPQAPPIELADPAAVVKQLDGKTLAPGDQILADILKAALKAGEAPCYRATIDAPFQDNAAPALRDELRQWIARKMSSLGFADAAGKPSVNWVVHLDPGQQGSYTLKATLRAGGASRFEQSFDVPATATADRMERVLAGAFSAPR